MEKLQISKTKKIILSALLLALYIILDRVLTFNTQIVVINVSLISVALAAIYLGPKYSILVGALGDLIGSLIMPFGPYFPGFTLSLAINGAIYGFMLYKNPNKEISNKKFLIRIVLANLLVVGIVGLFIDSFWISILYEKAFWAFMLTRIIGKSIIFPMLLILTIALEKMLTPLAYKYLYEEKE